MVTQELISYVTGELNKGKSKDQVRTVLLSGGGWSEEDLNEVFKMIPGGNKVAVAPSPAPAPAPKFIEPEKKPNTFQNVSMPSMTLPKITHSSSKTKELLIFLVIFGAVFASWYFFRPEIKSAWGKIRGSLPSISLPFFSKSTEPAPVSKAPTVPVVPAKPKVPKNCGTSTAPDRKNPTVYQKDAVLECLGASILLGCESANAVLNDPLFPTKFQVINNNDTCNFKLSYPDDSTLVDISGNKLAGQYIMCPIKVVKKMEERNKTVTFTIPDRSLASEFAAETYFYGNLGVFIENDFNQSKIKDLGCSGSFISSMIASYNKAQAKN